MGEKIADILDGLELFRDFSFPELAIVGKYLNLQRSSKGYVVFREGDPGASMLILVDGQMAVSKSGDAGSHLLSSEGKGRVVGEMALLDQERRSATCLAVSECEFLVLNQDGLGKLAADRPVLAYRLMFGIARLLSRRLRRTSGLLVDYLTD